jgi:thiamine-phosphate pyrophosphorylase
MVHDHDGLLDRFDIGGIHFTERRRLSDRGAIRRLRQQWPGCRISSAFHRIADIPASDGRLDYLFLSPIFDSISKPGYRAAFDRPDLEAFLSATDQRIVALGGIDGPLIAEAAALGFWGVAALGAVWAGGDPLGAVQALDACCRAVNG